MRLLAEYLSTKVKVSKGFPEVPKLEDILEFLKTNGFVEVKYVYNKSALKSLEDMAVNGHNAFTWLKNKDNDDEYWVRFCKSGKLSKENPVYFCRVTDDGHIKSSDIAYIEYCERGVEDKQFTKYDEFVKDVNEFFGW